MTVSDVIQMLEDLRDQIGDVEVVFCREQGKPIEKPSDCSSGHCFLGAAAKRFNPNGEVKR